MNRYKYRHFQALTFLFNLSSGAYGLTHSHVRADSPGTAREELILLHETVGYLSANLYEFSVRLNDLGGSNQLVYTAYTLGLWIYRWWHLIQYKGNMCVKLLQGKQVGSKVVHAQDCDCDYCEAMDCQATHFLQQKVIHFLTSPTYILLGEPRLEFGRKRHMSPHVSTRQLFEPGYDAWQNEQPFQFTEENENLFDKHLQISSICLRKEIRYLISNIETMYLVRHRPAFQSLRAVLRAAYEAVPVDKSGIAIAETGTSKSQMCISSAENSSKEETILKARELVEHFANCLERIAVINETGIDRAKQAQVGVLSLFQTEGVIVSLEGSNSAVELSF